MSAQLPVAALATEATAPSGVLDALATELAARGWITRPYAVPGRVPSLYVQNPDPAAAALSEHIYAERRADGTWAYWWSWAQPIATTVSQAADVITGALCTAGAL